LSTVLSKERANQLKSHSGIPHAYYMLLATPVDVSMDGLYLQLNL